MRRIPIFCLFSLIGPLCFSEVECVIKEIHFSHEEGYEVGNIRNQPVGGGDVWDERSTLNQSIVETNCFRVIDEDALQISQMGSGECVWAYINFPGRSSGNVIVSWTWRYIRDDSRTLDIGLVVADSRNLVEVYPNRWTDFGVS